jgi:hypothetical protein
MSSWSGFGFSPPSLSPASSAYPASGPPLLDTLYFEALPLEHSGPARLDGGMELHAFRLKLPANVLCDANTGRAVAVFMVQAHNDYVVKPDTTQPRPGSLAPTVLLPRPADASGRTRVHGLVGANEQFCEYLLTNVTGLRNRPAAHAPQLNINLVNVHNSGQINKTNVVAPGQTIKVYADESRGSHKIVLKGLTRTMVDPVTLQSVQHELSVTEDEAEVAAGTKKTTEGVAFALSVLPEAGHTRTEALFGKGVKLVWRVQDIVMVAVPRAPAPVHAFGDFGGSASGSSSNSSSNSNINARPSVGTCGGFGFGAHPLGTARTLALEGSSGFGFGAPHPPFGSSFGGPPMSSYTTGGFGSSASSFGATAAAPATSAAITSFGFGGAPSASSSIRPVAAAAAAAAAATFSFAPAASGFGGLSDFLGGGSSFGAAPRAAPPTSSQVEQSILDSQAAEVVSGGFASVHTVAVAEKFDHELAAPVCIVSLSVAIAKQIDKPARWLIASAASADTKLRALGGSVFQNAIELAYEQWIGAGKTAPLRLFRYRDPTHNLWFMIDFASLTGTHAPSHEVQGHWLIDPSQSVPLELHREAPSRPWVGGILPNTTPVRTHDAWVAYARETCAKFKSGVLAAQMSAITTYPSAECAICGDENPTVVVAMCGHQCYCTSTDCHSNPLLQRGSASSGFSFGASSSSSSSSEELCPICRQTVTGKVSL